MERNGGIVTEKNDQANKESEAVVTQAVETALADATAVMQGATENGAEASAATDVIVNEEAVITEDDNFDILGLGPDEGKFVDRVVHISRVAKVVKGGRRFSFSALVVCGNGQGEVGFGLGKANEVPDAIRKASEKARTTMIKVPMQNRTINHDVIGKYGAGCVVIKKASPGTGVIAGGSVRAVFESMGVHDVLTKCIGTSNPHNVVRATFNGLMQLKNSEERKLRVA